MAGTPRHLALEISRRYLPPDVQPRHEPNDARRGEGRLLAPPGQFLMRAAFAVQAALYLSGAVAIAIGYSGKVPSGGEALEGERFACTVALVHDGDTFRCTDGRIVLVAGVDARELDGSCLPDHPCPAASAEEATAELKRLLDGRTVACQVDGTTRTRVAAYCRRSDGLDLSCAMLASGTVAKWELFWRNHRCPS